MSEATQPIQVEFDPHPGHSTGPRTPEGKARSSMNALKEGFRSQKLIVLPHQEEEFQLLYEHMQRAFTPLGETETFIFEDMLYDAWNLQRVRDRILRLSENGIDPLDDPSIAKDYDRYLRYEARFESSLRANMRQLQNVQTTRVGQAMIPGPLEAGAMPALAKASLFIEVAKRTNKNFNAIAVNTYMSRANDQFHRRESKPPNTPLQFRDFLTELEKARF